MNKNLDFFAENNNIIYQFEYKKDFHIKDQDKYDDCFSLLEYNKEEEEKSFNELIIKNIKEDKLICSNVKINEENEVIPSIQTLNIFNSYEEESNSIFLKISKQKDSNKFDDLNSSEIIGKFELNLKILDNEKYIKENTELKGEKEKQSLKVKKNKIEPDPKIDINDDIIPKENDVNLINDDKKKMFISFKLFNPKGISKDLKEIRNYINTIILEKNKKEDKNKLFNIKKKNEKEIIIKRKRKHKPDDIRKKIKARFLKSLKNRINEELKKANSLKYFNFLPQCFICEISKKKNKQILNMTLRQIMTTNFFEKYKKIKKTKKKKEDNNQTTNNNLLNRKRKNDCPPDIFKYNNNNEVIKYLDNNEDIQKQFNFDVIGNMTFTELFNEYLESNEFEKDIYGLIFEDKEEYFYIKEYIIRAFYFIKDFMK